VRPRFKFQFSFDSFTFYSFYLLPFTYHIKLGGAYKWQKKLAITQESDNKDIFCDFFLFHNSTLKQSAKEKGRKQRSWITGSLQ